MISIFMHIILIFAPYESFYRLPGCFSILSSRSRRRSIAQFAGLFLGLSSSICDCSHLSSGPPLSFYRLGSSLAHGKVEVQNSVLEHAVQPDKPYKPLSLDEGYHPNQIHHTSSSPSL